MSWKYTKDAYCKLKPAIERHNVKMLRNPRIAAALLQIELAELAIDKIMEASDEEEYDHD